MAQKNLSVKLSLNDKQFQSSLKRATRSMKKFGSSMKRTGQTLSRNLTLPIIALGAASLKAFDTQAKAIAQVESGLKSTGEAAGFTSEQLQKMASDLQKKTIFGDEEILKNATSQLLTFTNISGEQFARTQKAALDLATRLDGDLKSASIQLGKALNDPIANLSALSRSGIQFSEEQKKVIKELAETNRLAEAQTIILDELDKQYGGSAEAAAQAGLGGIQQLKNSLGDLGEEFGAIISENIGPFIQKIKSLVESLKNASDEQKRNIVVYSGIAAVVGPLLIIFGQLIISLGAITKAVRLLSLAIASNPLGLFLTLLATAGAALIAFGAPSREFNTYQKDMKDSIDDTNQQLSTQEKLVNELNDATKTSVDRDKEKVDRVKESVKTLENENKNLQNLIDRYIDIEGPQSDYIKNIQKWIDANNLQIKSLQSAKDKFIDFKKEIPEATSFMKEFNSELQKEELFKDLENNLDNFFKKVELPSVDSLGLLEIGEEEDLEEMGFDTAKVVENFNTIQQAIQQTADVFSGSFNSMKVSAVTTFADIGKAALNSARDVIKAAIGQAIASQIAKIIATIPFPFNVAIASGAGTAVGALFDKAIPAFANGGIVSGPTLGIMGEYAGANTNPEVIAPLNKLKDMIGGQTVQVQGVISGEDIFLSNDRYSRRKNSY